MDYVDKDLLLYLGIIVLFLGFFLWNRRQTRKNRDARKDRHFRKRYHERKKERKNRRR